MIRIKNKRIAPILDTLDNITVQRSKQRRGKAKLTQGFFDKLKELQSDIHDIADRYCVKDEDGNVVKEKDGSYEIEAEFDKEQVQKEFDELYEEYANLDISEHREKIEAFYMALANDEFEAEDINDINFDYLMTILEEEF